MDKIIPACLSQLTFILISCYSSFAQPLNNVDSERGLFNSDSQLQITLVGPVRELFSDRSGDPREFSFTLREQGPASTMVEQPLKISTRGHFRRLEGNCRYPPLQLDFPKDRLVETSHFVGQNKLKLVVPCQGEKYVVREYLIYRLFNLLTPLSFRVRLVQVNFQDIEHQTDEHVLGFILETVDDMLLRNEARLIDRDLIKPEQIDQDNFLRVAIFQYMIGNTDWSVQYRQNIRIGMTQNSLRPEIIPYDFDHSGFVRAPYAQPAAALKLAAVTQRRYRGFCLKKSDLFQPVLEEFKVQESAFYQILDNCSILDHKSLKYCKKYLAGFFQTINSESKWWREFQYPCREGNTGNVVIKGLKE